MTVQISISSLFTWIITRKLIHMLRYFMMHCWRQEEVNDINTVGHLTINQEPNTEVANTAKRKEWALFPWEKSQNVITNSCSSLIPCISIHLRVGRIICCTGLNTPLLLYNSRKCLRFYVVDRKQCMPNCYLKLDYFSYFLSL